jgi:hypothetical protein
MKEEILKIFNEYKRFEESVTKGYDYNYIHEENFEEIIDEISALIIKDKIKLIQEMSKIK